MTTPQKSNVGYQSKLNREELIDALNEMIEFSMRKGICSTVEDWQLAIERVLVNAEADNG